MNDQTVKLLEQLANKLETTSEYLWNVLLSQAPIDSTIGLIQVVLLILTGWLLYRLHIKFDATSKNENYSQYDKYVGLPPLMFISAGIWIILSAIMLVCVGSIVTGFINPEYWALDKILNSISKN